MPDLQSVIRNPLLSSDPDHPRVRAVLEASSDDLANATRPSFLEHSDSPVFWGPAEWEGMDRDREDIFNWEKIEESFDPERFLVDGYAVFKDIMLPYARDRWVEAAKQGQWINDALIRADWSQIDWEGLGRPSPENRLESEAIEKAIGGSQQVPQSDDSAGVLTLRNHSVFAEYFPAGHLPFLMDVLTHPKMLALQRMALGTHDIFFDHNQLLTRPGGYSGGSWHSHKIGGGHDDCGTADLNTYRAQPNAVLNICYPEGFEAEDDGGLKIVRGSHLFRDPSGCRFPDDEAMEREWLADRTHPVTSEPLQIERLSLPPGSLVCCLSHAAHAVSPKAVDKETRWATLYCYKKADERTGLVLPSHAVPPVWAVKAQRGELPKVLTELFRPSYDRELTQGLTDPY